MGNTSSIDWKLDEHKDLPSSWQELEALIGKATAEPDTPEWKRFTEMKALDLHGNALVSVPPTIGRLASLTSLVLHSNKLEELPVEILELQHLQSIDVRDNQIRTLPEGFSVLIALRHIDVSFNRLSSLPTDFPVVVARLDTLYLSHNPFDGDLPLKSAIEKADLSAYRRLLGSGDEGVKDTEKKTTKIETKPTVPNVDLDAIARASGTTLTQSPRIAHKRRPPSKAHFEAQKIQADELREVLSIEPDEDGQVERKSERPITHGSTPMLSTTDYQPVTLVNPMAAAGLADIMKSGIGGLKLRKPGVAGSVGTLLKSNEGLDQNSSGSAPALAGVPLGSLKRLNGKEEATGDDRKEKEKEKEQEKAKVKENEGNMQNENKEKEKEKQQQVSEPEKEKDKDRPIPKWKQKTANPPPSDVNSDVTSAATSVPVAKSRPSSVVFEGGASLHPNTKTSSGLTSPVVRPYRSNSNSSQDMGARKDKDAVNAKEVDSSVPPWKRELMERKAKAAAQK